MKLRLRTSAFAIIAIVVGATVLLGYFIQIPFLQELRTTILNWVLILTAVVLLVGIFNLLLVHLKKIRTDEKNAIYSLFLVIALAVTFVIALVFGTDFPWSVFIYDHILLPVETSLVALLAVVLVYAVARMFWRGITLFNLIFAATVLFMLAVPALLSWMPELSFLSVVHNLFTQILALAGSRAILMGVALGVIATGLRVLIGADRPYEDEHERCPLSHVWQAQPGRSRSLQILPGAPETAQCQLGHSRWKRIRSPQLVDIFEGGRDGSTGECRSSLRTGPGLADRLAF